VSEESDQGAGSTLFGDQTVPINEDTIDAYREQHGLERTLGYLEALRDFNRQLAVIIGGSYTSSGLPTGHHRMQKLAKNLFHENEELLKWYSNRTDNNEKLQP
jgi:hypothetical protein